MESHVIRFFVCSLVVLWANPISADRVLNITLLENCPGTSDAAEVVIEQVDYHIDPATGLCDTVHGDFIVKAGESGSRVLTMTLYRCPNQMTDEACQDNPTEHVEVLDCKRLTEDDSGPWAMFANAILRANCGKSVGSFSLDYSTLKLNHLMNYLDIHDTGFATYRLRMVFVGQANKQLRACLNIDFELVHN